MTARKGSDCARSALDGRARVSCDFQRMELHEFDRLTAVTRRPAERERPVEHTPPLTMPTAMLSLQRTAGNESVSALVTQDEEVASSPVRQVVESGGGSP